MATIDAVTIEQTKKLIMIFLAPSVTLRLGGKDHLGSLARLMRVELSMGRISQGDLVCRSRRWEIAVRERASVLNDVAGYEIYKRPKQAKVQEWRPRVE